MLTFPQVVVALVAAAQMLDPEQRLLIFDGLIDYSPIDDEATIAVSLVEEAVYICE